MPRAKHYSKANLLWSNIAYCDQWEKIMVVYDEYDNLRAVIKEADDDGSYYNVLLIGDDNAIIYELDGIELGSTGKNMKACFEVYCRLQSQDTPTYVPSYRRAKQICLYQIFPHTRVGAQRSGGFHITTDDIGEKIASALKHYKETVNTDIKTIDCTKWDDYGYDSHTDTIYGYAGKMYHVGDGAYCDDDGDNWDFL